MSSPVHPDRSSERDERGTSEEPERQGALSRRTLLHGALGLGLAASAGPLLAACGGDSGVQQVKAPGLGSPLPPPETTRIRLPLPITSSCAAATAMAEPFLREEGFTDVVYRPMPLNETLVALGAGDGDFGQGYGAAYLGRIDAGAPIVMLGGLHVGCWQVFGTGRVRSFRDLKGGTIAIPGPGPDFLFKAFLGATLASLGIDLRRDVTLIDYAAKDAAKLLSAGRVDGLLAFPPLAQELGSRKIGRVILNSALDRPWSSYYCCMAAANGDWKRRYPVATKRALRAFLRAADATASDPHLAARTLVAKGVTTDLAHAHQNLRQLPYDVWRRFDPADTIRFYALRMKEAGLVTSTPEQLLNRGCDFSHFEAMRREL